MKVWCYELVQMTITLEVAFCFFHNVGDEETAETIGVTSWFV